jgi:hypothetical protein
VREGERQRDRERGRETERGRKKKMKTKKKVKTEEEKKKMKGRKRRRGRRRKGKRRKGRKSWLIQTLFWLYLSLSVKYTVRPSVRIWEKALQIRNLTKNCKNKHNMCKYYL